MSFTEKLERFRALLEKQEAEGLLRRHPDWKLGLPIVRTVTRRKYTLVDVGDLHNWSGKYMVENSTGEIFGIKGYGKIHRGHHYGNLDTIAGWNWSEFHAIKRPEGGEL